MLPSERWGPPVGLRGRAGCPLSILPCWGARGRGEVWGNPCPLPPTPPLPVPYILERHPLPGASQPKGGLQFALLFPPKMGTAREVHCSWAPRRTAIRVILDRVGSSGGEGASTSGPLCCTGGLPSAKRFPLSRSKNTKLGTPGTPLPRLPSPIPAPPQDGHLGWGAWEGVLGVLGSQDPNTGTPPSPSI